MPMVPFDQLPESARLWAFGCSRSLDVGEERELKESVELFLTDWAAHGALLTSSWEWRYHQFLFVAVDQSDTGPSGCSIDALVGRLRALGSKLGVDLLANSPVFYRDDSGIRRVTRDEFSESMQAGTVDLDTVVFDNTIQSVSELRTGRWELPAKESWHARAFSLV